MLGPVETCEMLCLLTLAEFLILKLKLCMLFVAQIFLAKEKVEFAGCAPCGPAVLLNL